MENHRSTGESGRGLRALRGKFILYLLLVSVVACSGTAENKDYTGSVVVYAEQPAGTMSSWWDLSAFATWVSPRVLYELYNDDAPSARVGLVRLSVEKHRSL